MCSDFISFYCWLEGDGGKLTKIINSSYVRLFVADWLASLRVTVDYRLLKGASALGRISAMLISPTRITSNEEVYGWFDFWNFFPSPRASCFLIQLAHSASIYEGLKIYRRDGCVRFHFHSIHQISFLPPNHPPTKVIHLTTIEVSLAICRTIKCVYSSLFCGIEESGGRMR